MNKANLARDARGRKDPKSLVLETVPGLQKSFRHEVSRNVYWRTVVRTTRDETQVSTLSLFNSLQEVIDTFFVDYPVLRPYASQDAIYAQIESNKNIPIAQIDGRKAYEYWECGGCQEDYWHPWSETKCPKCDDTVEGAIHASLEDVIMAGCPINWKEQEKWEADGMPERPEAQGKTDPGDELAARYYAGQIDSLGNPT